MKIEQGESSLISSSTSISDLFFTEYLSQANGDFVKVYMYLYFISKYNNDLKINDLAKKLELPLKTIQDALKYWEEQGLLMRKGQGFVLTNILEIEIQKLYKPKVSLSPENMKAISDNKIRSNAITAINDEFFQGVMSPSWYGDIDLWFKKYNFDEEVMISLFRYCFNRSALNRNYVATVASAWNKNKIKTFADLDAYFQKQEKLSLQCKDIKKKLRLTRNLSMFEEAYVEKWIMNYGYDSNVIDLALMKTTSKSNPSFEYIDKLISDWHERNFKTADQIKKYLENKKTMPIQKDTKSSKDSKTVNHSFKNLSDFYVNTDDDE